jgi:hypothetical protein
MIKYSHDLIKEVIASAVIIVFREDFVRLFVVESDFWTKTKGVIAAIAIGVVAIVLFRIYCKLRGPLKETSVAVYQRGELRLDRFLKKAKSEIDIFGITLEQTSREFPETLKEIINSEHIKSVRILICNPASPIRDQIIRQVDTNVGTIQSSLDSLKELNAALSKDVARKLQFKQYNEIPVQSIFILDRNTDSGVIRFEPYIFGIKKECRRIYEIRNSNKKQRPLFGVYCNSFDELWDSGHEVI